MRGKEPHDHLHIKYVRETVRRAAGQWHVREHLPVTVDDDAIDTSNPLRCRGGRA